MKINSLWISLKPSVLLFAIVGIVLPSCSNPSPYLVPEQESNRNPLVSGNEKVDIQIRPIFTSGIQSEDMNHYQFDFSQYFTAIEVHLQNKTSKTVQWDPFKSTLRDAQNKEYKTLNEEEAFNYYKDGDIASHSMVLIEKPYAQQKEEIDKIKSSMLKPVMISPGEKINGLLLFKKVSLNHCEKVILQIAGIQLNEQEKNVHFFLVCPEE